MIYLMYAQFPNSNSQTKIEAIKCHPILLENNSLGNPGRQQQSIYRSVLDNTTNQSQVTLSHLTNV